MRKNKDEIIPEIVDFSIFAEDASYTLIKVLSGYEEAIIRAAEQFEPSIIARYVVAVATAFNKFYHECPILTADTKNKQARLVLVDLAQNIIKDAFSLLGIACPEEM